MIREVSEKYVSIYQKAMKGKSRGAAIKSFCLECCGYVRAEVSLCTDKGCPLYPYRPYRSAAQVQQARKSLEGPGETSA